MEANFINLDCSPPPKITSFFKTQLCVKTPAQIFLYIGKIMINNLHTDYVI